MASQAHSHSNPHSHWLQKKMQPEQQQKWLDDKDEQLESYRQEALFKQGQKAYAKSQEVLHSESTQSPLHEIFLSDDLFDPQMAGRLLNDYEVELLSDLSDFPQARLVIERSSLRLKVGEEILKQYENQYATYIGLFLAKRLVDDQSHLIYGLNERGRAALVVAKELASKEIEEWESWRGMPNLYRLNSREISGHDE